MSVVLRMIFMETFKCRKHSKCGIVIVKAISSKGLLGASPLNLNENILVWFVV